MSLISAWGYELGFFWVFFFPHKLSLHSQPKSVLNTSPSNPTFISHESNIPLHSKKKGFMSNSFRSFKMLYGVF